MTNSDIADILSALAKLMDLHGENAFKSKALANASFQIDRLTEQLSELEPAAWGPLGLSASTAEKAQEILSTGTLTALETLRANTPEGILELMGIKGIGPKKLAVIWKELSIESPGELLYACVENRLVHYKGFGEKTQQNIREALEYYLSNQHLFLYAALFPALAPIEALLQQVLPENSYYLSGDMAMQADILEAIDIITTLSPEEIKQALLPHTEWALREANNDHELWSFLEAYPVRFYCYTGSLLQHHLQHSCSSEFIHALCAHNPNWETIAQEQTTEQAFFQALQLPYSPAYLRHQASALTEGIPADLIQVDDIRGIIHSHSNWSDGGYSIEDMAKACIAQGYEYLVLSDHSVTSFYANGLSAERIKEQHKEIDRLNAKLAPFTIFKSIECDILNDGRLDYDNEVLASFDIVIASVHQHLRMSEEKAMQRVMAAIENPYTHILGHSSGRLLLSRPGYPLNYEQVIDACAKHKVVLEINAHPRRLDLDWQWISLAQEKNVMLSINPDAHSVEGIHDVFFGVRSAQKGLLRKQNNLSSLPLNEFKAFIASLKK